MRFGTDFGPKISKKFRGRKILRSKSREIAPKSMPLGGAELAYDCKRSPTAVRSVGMLWRVRLRRIPDRKVRKFSRPQNFAFEIA